MNPRDRHLNRGVSHMAAYCLFTFAFLFCPDMNWRWIEGWVFLALFGAFLLTSLLALSRHPHLLVARVSGPFRKDQPPLDKGLFIFLSALHLLWIVGIGMDPFRRAGQASFGFLTETIGGLLFAATAYFMHRVVCDNPFLIPAVSRQEGQRVVGEGVYGRVRHPMYAVLIAMSAGGALLTSSPAGLGMAALISVALWCRLSLEERFMRMEFPEYEAYARRVRYRLFPLLI